MHKNYLITGAQGSGKSTLREIFAAKGYQTIDIDDGYADWKDKASGQIVPYNPDGGMEWLMKVNFVLNAAFTALLEQSREHPLLVFGGTGDLTKHLKPFDKIYLLEYPDQASAVKRLSERTNNQFGKHADEITSVLRYMGPYQQIFKDWGAITINCMLPIDEIAVTIENDINNS